MLHDGVETFVERRSACGDTNAGDSFQPFFPNVGWVFNVMSFAAQALGGASELRGVVGVFPADCEDQIGFDVAASSAELRAQGASLADVQRLIVGAVARQGLPCVVEAEQGPPYAEKGPRGVAVVRREGVVVRLVDHYPLGYWIFARPRSRLPCLCQRTSEAQTSANRFPL